MSIPEIFVPYGRILNKIPNLLINFLCMPNLLHTKRQSKGVTLNIAENGTSERFRGYFLCCLYNLKLFFSCSVKIFKKLRP